MRIFNPNRLELLNIGCGRQFHEEWKNLDMEPCSDRVQRHNIIKGIPFGDENFDGVYHSHLLEHLTPENGKQLIQECYRVLKPGGVLRIVVPDLEQITRLYLESHDRALCGDQQAKANYEWMKLELLDQMVRGSSGGKMGQFMTDPHIINFEFVKSRIGEELQNCSPESANSSPDEKDNFTQSKSSKLRFFAWPKLSIQRRRKLAGKAVGWLLGKEKRAAFEEGLFRNQGEVHRWMYDRFSLEQLCLECGFDCARVCSPEQSEIEDFAAYQLDAIDGRARKPDSLFMEFIKPANTISRRLAA